MAAGGFYFFVSLAGYLSSLFVPDREIGNTIHGAQGSGKTTLFKSIRNGFVPIYDPRVPTTAPQQPNIIKVHLEDAPRGFRDYRNTDWIVRDMPHDVKYIPEQIFFVWPEIIWWVVSADPTDKQYWKHDYNWQVASAIKDALGSTKYQQETKNRLTLTTPMVRRRGVRKRQIIKKRRKVRYIILCINKIDIWEQLPVGERVANIKAIRDHFFGQEQGGNPLTWFREPGNPGQLLVLGTSFKEGYCLRPNDAVQQPLAEYFTYLLKQIVSKKG